MVKQRDKRRERLVPMVILGAGVKCEDRERVRDEETEREKDLRDDKWDAWKMGRERETGKEIDRVRDAWKM